MNEKLVINLCPTGMVPTRGKVPHVPLSPKEIALDVKRCYELGVSIVHIHARDENGIPTWHPDVFDEILSEIKTVTPDIILTVSTSGRNWSEIEKRSASLKLKDNRPDMASLTLGSMNIQKFVLINPPEIIHALAAEMLENNIVPELEAFDTGMINYAVFLIKKGILKPPYYFNLLLGSLGTASLNSHNVSSMINALPEHATWALAGIGRFQLQANTLAIALGGHVRVGLEDNPYFDWDGKINASNPRLVERIVKIAKELGREPATSEEARKIIGFKQ